MDWPVLAQSSRKALRPVSVKACLKSWRSTLGGRVATWGADLGRLYHVLAMAHRGHQHLALQVRILPVDGHDLADQVHAVLADVVEPADEGRDEAGAGLGC